MTKRFFSKAGIFSLFLLVQLTLAAGLAAVAHAGEVDALIDKLVEKGVLSRSDAETILQETKEAKKAKPKEEAKIPSWVQKIKLAGDLRLRYQYEDRDSAEEARNRARFRWRLGADANVVDSFTVGFGLASGGDDPRSTNQTFQDTFSSKGIRIDYAYVKYAPFEWLSMTGGKFKNPLWLPSDLLWDSDINPEGAVLQLKHKMDPIDVFFSTGVWVLDERSSGGDPILFPFQLGIDWKITKDVNLLVAPTYYLFSSVQGKTLDFSEESNTLENGVLKYDYNSIGIGAELGFKDTFVPYIGVFGEYIYNPDPDEDNDGYLAGIAIGNKKVSDKGQWQLKYMYRRLERDAWPDTFPDSDFFGGATNVEGHEMAAEYALFKNVTLGLDYYHSEEIDAKDEEDILQFDLVFKF